MAASCRTTLPLPLPMPLLSTLLVLLLVLLSSSPAAAFLRHQGHSAEKGDQLGCAACVILLGLRSGDVGSPSESFCGKVPRGLRARCAELTEIVEMFDKEMAIAGAGAAAVGPEDFCARRGFCDRPQCRLWDAEIPKPAPTLKRSTAETREWKWENILEHLPVRDDDNDYFSPIDTLRGGSWRGKDCNDVDGGIHPGRRQNDLGPDVDHNCNGIAGTDEAGNSLEEVLCGKSQQKGVIVLGDSISAHFHIPVPSRANLTLDDLFLMALNEVDYPQCSWATGFATDYKLCSEVSTLKLTSIYRKLWERNHCNHRDYQNISRNGARSTSMARDIVSTTSRRSALDQPAIVFYSMLANDVCNGNNGTGKMTSPAEFQTMVVDTLTYLDTILPPGSTVFLVGLIHGELMWESLYDKPHFIGATYGALWDFLACLEETACWAWLNADPAWRQAGSDWAESLRVVLRALAQEQKYTNFNVHYIEHPDREYHRDYIAAGGNIADLYEVMDGGHPSLTGEILMAEYIWQILERDFPDVLGPVNPNNQRITELFGDQGGF